MKVEVFESGFYWVAEDAGLYHLYSLGAALIAVLRRTEDGWSWEAYGALPSGRPLRYHGAVQLWLNDPRSVAMREAECTVLRIARCFGQAAGSAQAAGSYPSGFRWEFVSERERRLVDPAGDPVAKVSWWAASVWRWEFLGDPTARADCVEVEEAKRAAESHVLRHQRYIPVEPDESDRLTLIVHKRRVAQAGAAVLDRHAAVFRRLAATGLREEPVDKDFRLFETYPSGFRWEHKRDPKDEHWDLHAPSGRVAATVEPWPDDRTHKVYVWDADEKCVRTLAAPTRDRAMLFAEACVFREGYHFTPTPPAPSAEPPVETGAKQ